MERFLSGDCNLDGSINVLDIVKLVNFILESDVPNCSQEQVADLNEDGEFNILDVVVVVNIVLGR